MASIENCSRIQVTVKNRDDLTKQFAHNAGTAVQRDETAHTEKPVELGGVPVALPSRGCGQRQQ